MDKYERRRLNLIKLRDAFCAGSNADLARRLGRDPSYISRMLYPEGKSGRKRIADDMMDVIGNAFGIPKFVIDADDLDPLNPGNLGKSSQAIDAGQESSGASTPVAVQTNERRDIHGHSSHKGLVLGILDPWDDDTPLGDDEVELPLFKEVEISGGVGRAAPSVELTDMKLRFSAYTLRKAGVDPANAACATLRDHSMERLIMDGSTIGVDRGRTIVKDGRIFAIEYRGELRAKYLYRLPGGGLRLRSENSAEYPDEVFGADWPEYIRVLGWVFWWSRLETW